MLDKKILEVWARGVDSHTDNELDADADYRRIDTSLALCPICHNHPRAWLSEKNDVGVLRCCNFGCVIVSGDLENDPVTQFSIEQVWHREIARKKKEKDS